MIEFKNENVSYKINKEGLTLDELMQEFKYFLLAIGYQPENVKNYIEER